MPPKALMILGGGGRLDGFVFGVADVFDFAVEAAGLAGDAEAAAVPDELVGEEHPFIFGQDLDEILLDFFWVGVFGEVEAVGEADDVGIDDDAAGDSVAGAEDDVAGLAGDAGEGEDLLHGLGDNAAEFFDEFFGGAHDGFCFVAEETGGADFLFELTGVGVGEMFWRGIFFEERGRDLVDADVGALGGEDGGDEELEGVVVDEFAGGGGVHGVEAGEDGGDADAVGAAQLQAGLEIEFGGGGRRGGFLGGGAAGFFCGRFHFLKITQPTRGEGGWRAQSARCEWKVCGAAARCTG
jgi:hypothetical protein